MSSSVLKANATNARLTPTSKAQCLTLTAAFDQFFDAIPNGNIEENTLKMLHIHKRHLFRIFKPQFEITSLTGQSLQNYVKQRSKETTQYFLNKPDKKNPTEKQSRTFVSATTIRKEIAILGSLWRWAATIPLVSGPFPNGGLRYPKTSEKPPFQTWPEIQRQIDLGQQSFHEAESMWDCLYLRNAEIGELLKHAKQHANFEFIYPMFAMAAYTGARRSEILRSKRSDFDFDQEVVTIHERKRVKGRNSTRRVPMTQKLKEIMREWFEKHPGGPEAFAQLKEPNSRAPSPITADQAHSHF